MACELGAFTDALCKLVSLQERIRIGKKMRRKLCDHTENVFAYLECSFGSLKQENAAFIFPRERLYPQKEGQATCFVTAQCMTYKPFDLRTYMPATCEKAMDDSYIIMPRCIISLALLPWSYALSSSVCFSRELCKAERYELLASAYRSITFFGFDEQTVSEGQERERKRRLKQGVVAPLMAEDTSELYRSQIRKTQEEFAFAQALDLDGEVWQERLHQAHVMQRIVDLNDYIDDQCLARFDTCNRM